MVVPYIDVSHLASASSFYSAVLQPLGLSYISSQDVVSRGGDPPPPASVITYGFDGEPILQIRQNPTPLGPPRLSSLVLTAPSRSAVVGFHTCGLRANPPLVLPGGQRPWLSFDGGVSRAVVYDLDGNTMEAVYPASFSAYDAVQYSGPPIHETQSTRDEVGRILDWNYDVASARPAAGPTLHHRGHPRDHYSSAARRPEPPIYPLRRSLTHDPAPSTSSRSYGHSLQPSAAPQTTMPRHPPQPEPVQSDSPRQSSLTSGLSTTTVLGALLGVAAGAAVTYGLVSHDRERKPIQEVDPAPLLPRRSTFPEKMSDDRKSRYSDRESAYGGMAPRLPVDDYYSRGVNHYHPPPPPPPPPSMGSSRKRIEGPPPRHVVYADVADDYENVWTSPRYLTNGSYAPDPSVVKGPPRSRVLDEDDVYETRSRHSSRAHHSRAPSVRSRSETPLARDQPTYVLERGDYQNPAPSRHGAVPRSTYSHAQPRTHRSSRDTDRDSYVSARTHRSVSTTRPPRVRLPLEDEPYEERELVMRSRAPSKASASRPPISGSQMGVGGSSRRARSQVSARHVPLPMSGIGSSHADWDDDLISLAPSDSISCVGSKSSRRGRR
jgi:hypothetical protein